MKIEFITEPDCMGKGRVIVGGRYYGLPLEAVMRIMDWRAIAWRGESMIDIELERKAFERWFADGDPGCKSIERSGESYRLMATHQAWKVWQARAEMDSHAE